MHYLDELRLRQINRFKALVLLSESYMVNCYTEQEIVPLYENKNIVTELISVQIVSDIRLAFRFPHTHISCL